MTASKRRLTHADRLALGAWIAVALTSAGWVLGIVLAFLSGEGQAKGVGPVTMGILGILLFVAGPATAVVLAVRAALAGHQSGSIAVMVSGWEFGLSDKRVARGAWCKTRGTYAG